MDRKLTDWTQLVPIIEGILEDLAEKNQILAGLLLNLSSESLTMKDRNKLVEIMLRRFK